MNDKTVHELYDDALAASNAAGFAFMPVAQVIDQQDAEIMQLRAGRDALKADAERYRWLRDKSHIFAYRRTDPRYGTLDDDIDAERTR